MKYEEALIVAPKCLEQQSVIKLIFEIIIINISANLFFVVVFATFLFFVESLFKLVHSENFLFRFVRASLCVF